MELRCPFRYAVCAKASEYPFCSTTMSFLIGLSWITRMLSEGTYLRIVVTGRVRQIYDCTQFWNLLK